MKHLFEKSVIVLYFVLMAAGVQLPKLFYIGIIGLSVYLLTVSAKELITLFKCGKNEKEKY